MSRTACGRVRVVAGFAAALLVLVAVACGAPKRIPAVGPNGEISVFTNLPAGDPAIDSLRAVYAYPVDVVGPETAFYLDFTPIAKFNVHRHVKNQLYLVDMSRDDAITRSVPGYLGVEGRKRLDEHKAFRWIVHDLHAEGQTTLFLVGWSSADLAGLLSARNAPQLRRELEDSVVRGLMKTLYVLGEDLQLEQRLALDYGWTMRLPNGFTPAADPNRQFAAAGKVKGAPSRGVGVDDVAADGVPGGFLKLYAETPVRLLLVHWREEDVPLTEEAWEPVLDALLWRYNDQDFVQPDRCHVFPVTFDGLPALKWEGIWQNEKYVIGGPFRAFAFSRGTRSYLLVGQVFDPGEDKVPTLRQLEAILRSFRVVE